MNPADKWTGRTASALQAALRMSNEGFAAHLGIGVRTVASWHEKPDLRQRSEMQQLLDRAYERIGHAERARFAELTGAPTAAPTDPRMDDPNITSALEWIDQHAHWPPGTARRAVAAKTAQLDTQALRDRSTRRSWVTQSDTADALTNYYGTRTGEHGLYTARFGDELVTTSILTCADWLDLDCDLRPASDRFRVATAQPGTDVAIDECTTTAAVHRLAESLAMNTRLVNSPLFRALTLDIAEHQLSGSFGITHFVHYALTMDLLEGELVDAITAGGPLKLPLRDHYLPDLASALSVGDRLCAGGALALTAIARPADPFRGPADYVLLVQERSGNVLNANRRLAVIPKGFHQPLTDVRHDAQIGATLRREMEEELFGRPDIDNTVADSLTADPMHPTLMSEPMRWLMQEPGRLRMETTGFGLNLVSGNFEFASLIVIEDEEFWRQYGGVVAANWESTTLRQYSTTDAELVTELLSDVAWSNEGLFAMTQGLRRLAGIGGERVRLPVIEWEISE
ncbi:hypothetical protein [Amycolatopsis jejuensis]|uniref:hypothetical protein n=1 Tax=Amycolatopsis jejuensis TaxID=330084 RepID=UPI00052550E1|nr:hypothetical protein [Amycolatopsis jejuensis]